MTGQTAALAETMPEPKTAFAERRGAGWLIPLAVLLAWELCGQFGMLPRYIVAPSRIGATWWGMLVSGELTGHAASSLFRQSLGLLIGASCGTIVGVLAGVFAPISRFYEPLVSLIYPVPKVAILPLIFVWFGLGDLSKIVVMTISIFFPTYIAAYHGAKSVQKIHIWTALNAGATRARLIRQVVIPSALPDIFNGWRIGLALSFVLMVTTELVVSTKGLGYVIARAEENLRFDRMYAAILTIAILGFCADRLLLKLRGYLLVGQLMSKDSGHG